MKFESIDRSIAGFMHRYGHGRCGSRWRSSSSGSASSSPLPSPAEDLVLLTVDWMPLLSPESWLAVIGWWEVAIGVLFLFRPTIRFAIALLAMQMVGTFMPSSLPSVTRSRTGASRTA